MKTSDNPWDYLAGMFHTGDDKHLSPFAADNALIAWPAVTRELEKIPKGRTTHVIDFGCGTGGLCRMLSREGYRTTGIDSSIEMIQKAKSIPTERTCYLHGNETTLERIAIKADAVVSVMVTQFIDDPDIFIRAAYKALKPEGLAIIAVFNPEFIERCAREEKLFEKIAENLNTYRMQLQGQTIKTHLRDESWYKDLFETRGFSHEHTTYPPFTEYFLKSIKWELPSDVPEYMVMMSRKKV